MKHWRTTLIVGGIFVALLSYVLVAEVGRERPPETGVMRSPTPVKVLDIPVEDARAVSIADGERTVRLVREGETWQVEGGASGPADVSAVARAVSDLANLEARFPVDDPTEDRTTYGLDPAALTLVVEMAEGSAARAHVVHVGRETPDRASYYVQREGDPAVYVVEHYRLSRFFEWLITPPLLVPPAPISTPDGE
jgi:hypothetical protein